MKLVKSGERKGMRDGERRQMTVGMKAKNEFLILISPVLTDGETEIQGKIFIEWRETCMYRQDHSRFLMHEVISFRFSTV